MKIISKYKDYYDYLQGIYGIDDKLILDRRDFNSIPKDRCNEKVQLIIGDKILAGYHYNNEYYFGQKRLDKLNEITKSKKVNRWDEEEGVTHWILDTRLNCNIKGFNNDTEFAICEYTVPKYKESVILGVKYKYPKLSDYNISFILDPHTIWLILNEYLSRKVTEGEPIVPVGDDKVRLLSAGFDPKTSFRK
jgi:hypothetical protein